MAPAELRPGIHIALRDSALTSLPPSSARSKRARSVTVEITPPAAPSPCGGGCAARTTAPSESTRYGFASAAPSSGGSGRARCLRAERVIPAGTNTSRATSAEKGIPATSAIGRDPHE